MTSCHCNHHTQLLLSLSPSSPPKIPTNYHLFTFTGGVSVQHHKQISVNLRLSTCTCSGEKVVLMHKITTEGGRKGLQCELRTLCSNGITYNSSQERQQNAIIPENFVPLQHFTILCYLVFFKYILCCIEETKPSLQHWNFSQSRRLEQRV